MDEPVFVSDWLITAPVPPVEFPLQLIVLPGMQEVNAVLNVSPEHIVIVSGIAVTSGTCVIVIVLLTRPVTLFPQASVMVGGGTVIAVVVSQVTGQLGMVKFRLLITDAVVQPPGVPPLMLPVIHG